MLTGSEATRTRYHGVERTARRSGSAASAMMGSALANIRTSTRKDANGLMGEEALALVSSPGKGLAAKTCPDTGEEAVLVLPLALRRLVLHSLLHTTDLGEGGRRGKALKQRRGSRTGHPRSERGGRRAEQASRGGAHRGGRKRRGRGGKRPCSDEGRAEEDAGHIGSFGGMRRRRRRLLLIS